MELSRTILLTILILLILGCGNNGSASSPKKEEITGKWLWCPSKTSEREDPAPFAAHTFIFTEGELKERYEYFSDRACTTPAAASYSDPMFLGYPDDFYGHIDYLHVMEDYQADWGTGEVLDLELEEFADYSLEDFENYGEDFENPNEARPFIEGKYELGSSITLDSGEEVKELTIFRENSALIGQALCYTHVVISGDSFFLGESCDASLPENEITINYQIEYKKVEVSY